MSFLWFFKKKAPASSPQFGNLGHSHDDVLNGLISNLLQDRREDRRARFVRVFLYFLIFGAPTLIYFSIYAHTMGWGITSNDPVVGLVRVEGPIAPGSAASADKVIPVLNKAFAAPEVKAVVLSIDSPGGAPLESERIYRTIETLRKTHKKPVIAVINNIGASAAYMVALHADRIYAGRYSIVGSIGAVLEGWDVHKALEKYDVAHRVYASGELKSMLNPYVSMSPDADRKAQDLVNKMGMQFTSELQTFRGKLLKKDVNYGTGEPWGGQEAVDNGVVDELGTIDDVVKARWDLPIKDMGPGNSNLPFLSTASEWLQGVLAGTFTKITTQQGVALK